MSKELIHIYYLGLNASGKNSIASFTTEINNRYGISITYNGYVRDWFYLLEPDKSIVIGWADK